LITAEYPATVKDRDAADWEALARREPYFPVLTSDGVRDEAFLETGEVDVSLLLAAMASIIGRDIPLTSVLDFGCGAGRLTVPLARRAARVTACDVAPSVLEHARQNVAEAGLSNVMFVEPGELARIDVQFDFVCSLLVFEYIHPAEGYETIRALTRLLVPGGFAALQITLEPDGGGLHRLARMHHKASRMHRALSHRIQRPSWMKVNAYDERVIRRTVADVGAAVVGRLATEGGEAVLVIQRSRHK